MINDHQALIDKIARDKQICPTTSEYGRMGIAPARVSYKTRVDPLKGKGREILDDVKERLTYPVEEDMW